MEDFDIQTLSAYLHLTPDQVRKMAERGKLPGRRIGGQWRFSRAEIHTWFENRIGVSDEKELVAVEKVFEIQATKETVEDFHIPDLLRLENIFSPGSPTKWPKPFTAGKHCIRRLLKMVLRCCTRDVQCRKRWANRFWD